MKEKAKGNSEEIRSLNNYLGKDTELINILFIRYQQALFLSYELLKQLQHHPYQ
jgi:hypothetical protein